MTKLGRVSEETRNPKGTISPEPAPSVKKFPL
jgi:hypothetical protein